MMKRLLGALIRADVQGATHSTTNVSRLFVLPQASLTDLAIISNACDLHPDDCAFLNEELGWLRRRTLMRTCPEALRQAHQFAVLGGRVEVVAVSVFWSRSPDYESSLAKLLLSERWMPTSRLRRAMEVLVNRTLVQVVCAQPIELGKLLAGQPDPERALRRTARLLRILFKNQRLALLGPELSLKRRAMASVLSQAPVRLEIQRWAAATGEGEARVEKRARQILKRMVSDFSAITLRFVYRFAHWSWSWSGATFDIRGLEGVRAHAQSANLVYLPCHQSHLDYIVLSYILYDQGLSLPHIAAGDNLNLPFLGLLLRQCGAFFIRRSFRNDDLYRSLITQYLRLILMRGHTVEFFLEGSRSRTGFLMPPRHGMLQVTMGAAKAAPPRPLALVPVRYAYERVLDAESYARERGGATKHGESWLDALKSFIRLRSGLGRIGVFFGEPIRLDIADAPSPNELAERILRRINAGLMLTSSHLLALAFADKRRLDEGFMAAQLELYIGWLSDEGIEVLTENIDACIAAGQGQGLIAFESFAGARWLSMTPKGARLLPWYRNNALHGLLLPSLMCLAGPDDADSSLLDLLCKELKVEKPEPLDFERWGQRLQESGVLGSPVRRRRLSALLQPTVERVLLILIAAQQQPASLESLIAESQRRAIELGGILCEPLTRDTARLSAHALLSASVIEETPQGINCTPAAEQLQSAAEHCLPDRVCRALSAPS